MTTYLDAGVDIDAGDEFVERIKPDAIVHTAAQPSHDRAADIPFDDFDTNAVGTLNLLEAARRSCPARPSSGRRNWRL